MKKYILFLLLLSAAYAHAQNLVKNPSFEEYEDCPIYFSEVYPPTSASPGVQDWYRATGGSSDYYNACSSSTGTVNVPNAFVYQEARDGEAFLGEYSPNWNSSYHEYIEGNLISPLIAGHRIYVSFWIVMAWASTEMSDAGAENIGAHFSDDYIYESAASCVDVVPQVVSPVGYVFEDTLNWEQVSGMFTAAGGEQWVTIGNFAPDDSGTPHALNYHFIDDVCVLDIDGPAGTGTVYDTFTCSGNPVTLNAGISATDYLWDDNSTASERVITDTGTYWVKSINYATCSMHADTFRVTQKVLPAPVDLGNDTIICSNAPILLSVDEDNFDSYTWNTGAQDCCIEVTYPGKYYVTATSDCNTGTDTILISAPPKPLVALPEDMILCAGTPVALGAGQPGMTYSWSTGSDKCCIEVIQSGTYSLTMANICDEASSDEVKITYSGCDNCLMAPSAFSPNDDGLNDKFEVMVNCMTQSYKLTIFNRWGQLVFASSKPGEGWDGTINGQSADGGVYFYYVEATPVIKEIGKLSKKGDITLLR